MAGLTDLVADLTAGRATARSLLDAALARADAAEAASVFAVRLDAEARAAAETADQLRREGDARPLLGVPVTVKDNLDLAGHPTTAGSRLLAGAAPAAADAAVVRRLRDAGMILLGRTGMTEFAFSGLGLNPHHGTPANPGFAGEPRIPGGSSAGAAVSVALGIVPAAIGTDTGGSVRIPAALCGLVGFKATAAAISREGVLPLSATLDSLGIIAGSVRDCRALFDVVRDRAGEVPAAPADRPLRLGVVRNHVEADLGEDVRCAYEGALKALAAAGSEIIDLEIAALDAIAGIAPVASFSAAEAFAWHRPHVPEDGDGAYDPRVVARIRPGGAVDKQELAAMTERRAAFVVAFRSAVDGWDALVWPTVPFVAPTVASLSTDAAYHAANALALRNSTIANLADGCAISLPCADAGGGPVGLTLARAGGWDDALLDVAAAVEALLTSAFR